MKKTYIKPENVLVTVPDSLLDTIQQSTGGGGTIDDGGRLDAPRFEPSEENIIEQPVGNLSIWKD